MSLRALVWYFQGRQVEATRLCEEALAESEPDRVVRAKILLAAHLHGQLDMKRSVRELVEALEILERGEEAVDDDLMAEALSIVPTVLSRWPRRCGVRTSSAGRTSIAKAVGHGNGKAAR